MAGRLKRRSIIGRRDATRESFGPAPIAVGEVLSSNALLDSAMGEDEEAAERKARNLQRRQNQVEQEVQESPGLERQGSSRRSVGGGISGLSNAQLAEHYQHCLKLSAENKVSAKNAFNLQLIDWMAQAIVKKRKHGMEGEVDMSDFQIAAGTLDASTKIYAFRVDSVYNDVFKLASGLGQSKQPEMSPNDSMREGDDGETGEIDPASGEVLKKKKRIKKGSTIEKNLKNINISKMELEFDVDPLFKKTTSQFDVAGGGGNQFLASLRLRDESGELLMDSDTIIDSRDAITPRKTAGPARIPPILSDLTELQLCPDDLREFSFMKWNLEEEDRLNKSISASQEERSNENAFDAFAVPEPVDDYRMEETEGMVDHDTEDDYDEATVVSERAVGHAALQTTGPGFTATLQMSSTDMLSILTSAPLEYSYFDTGKLGAWAGPKHWKFKSLMNAKLSDQVNKGGRKKKEISKIDYDEFEEMVVSMMNKVTDLLKLPKKSVKLVEKTMKGWNRERSTLPEDLHYSGHELVRLKHVVGLVVAQTSKTEGQAEEVDEDVGDYDYENAGDNDGYCPDLDSQEVEGGPSILENGGTGEEGQDISGHLGEEGDLVEAPKTVDKAALQIGYAKTAKKVDMQRIKQTAWKILTQASSEDKENDTMDAEKQTDDQAVMDTSFCDLYRTLKQPNKLPKTMSETLSVPLAFIALLHLCNDNSLKLTALDDTFTNFSINKN